MNIDYTSFGLGVLVGSLILSAIYGGCAFGILILTLGVEDEPANGKID